MDSKRKVARTEVRRFGEEWQVRAWDECERRFFAADYFTSDHDDAVATAALMVNAPVIVNGRTYRAE